MTSRDFCFWLQGWLEICGVNLPPGTPLPGNVVTPAQLECIQRHLALVFEHEIDPSIDRLGDLGKKHKEALDALHKHPLDQGSPLFRC